MSSFFTLPASQKKRKRVPPSDQPAKKRSAPAKRREERGESISGSDVSEDDAPVARNEAYESSDDEDEEFANEDPAAKRIRLAEQYLANTQKEVLDDAAGFDAAEVDAENLRRRMGERLKEDTAESKGKLYRWIADDFDWTGAKQTVTRVDGKSATSVAVQGQYVYVAQSDMAISRWEIPPLPQEASEGSKPGTRPRTKPKRVAYVRGRRDKKRDREYMGHVNRILCIATSQDGKFVATGGADNRIVIWDAAGPTSLKPLKVFTHHRDSVGALAFRRGTNQMFSASRDRTVKIWSLDELAYVETLFGHQDEVVDVSALAEEKCVTVGARDRTARLWKVVEESRLVFRGGGAPSKSKSSKRAEDRDSAIDMPSEPRKAYHEGSIDRLACIDDETFITGSDNGSLSLWNIHKKKPVFTYALAHGVDPPLPLEQLSAEEVPTKEGVWSEEQPRWITALRAIPFSNVFVTGSWDGCVRAWQITEDKRRIEPLGPLGGEGAELAGLLPDEILPSEVREALQTARTGGPTSKMIVGVINDLAIVDRGERAKDGVLVAAAVGKEHRLGRWGGVADAKSSLILFHVPRKALASEEPHDAINGIEGGAEDGDDFAGFD